MWQALSKLIIRNRILLLGILAILVGFMAYQATKVEMSYDFTNAIPTDNPKYQDFQNLIQTFGEDGNRIMIGIQSDNFNNKDFFLDYKKFSEDLEKSPGIINVLDITKTVKIIEDEEHGLNVENIFKSPNAEDLNQELQEFYEQEFYKGLIYNPENNTYLLAATINDTIMASKNRSDLIESIVEKGDQFAKKHDIEIHYSGLPFIRVKTADMIQGEIGLFLGLSFLLTAIILFLFFRSFTAVITSLLTVAIGVIFSFGTLTLLGYKITILTGMIPPLVVVVGIPNCIYFLNKYHIEYGIEEAKIPALENMISKMGIVTLFTNLTTAIGFGVFFFTKSVILKEFGLVAGLNIMGLFFTSIILIPSLYSFLTVPKTKHTGYLESKWLNNLLTAFVKLSFKYRSVVYICTLIILGFTAWGIANLKSVGHIVDDLPQSNKVYTDLKFFEKNFKGVMPLEILIDTDKKYGAVSSLDILEKADELMEYMESKEEIGGGLTLTKVIKFAKQSLSDEYELPDPFEFGALRPQIISMINKRSEEQYKGVNEILNGFLNDDASIMRLSVQMADVGSQAMPYILKDIEDKAAEIFEDDENITITTTGSSVTYLEGSKFIIHSLRDSLILAFTMIVVCMFILFRDWRILSIAIVTNIIPLAITAGIMGAMGIPLKPSTVLVFSVTLGITVDVSIRFLVNFKQDILIRNNDIQRTVLRTIRETGLSIIFTSFILVAGFGVFTLSSFEGTKALGYLISLTLFLAMIFNLSLQPALLLWMHKVYKKKGKTLE